MADIIDYQEVLCRYMAHVIACEGSSFIDNVDYDQYLSVKDRKVLEDIEEKILNGDF